MFPTSDVIDGVCYAYAIWKNQAARMLYFIWNFLSFYVIVLFIFVFCYWRIVLVIRRQASVMANHAASGSSAVQNQLNQIQSNVTKTMILVSVCYAIAWLPHYIDFLIVSLHPHPIPFDGAFYAAVLWAYSYMCINPFIYATKLDPVRQILLRLIPCKKTSEQVAGSAAWPIWRSVWVWQAVIDTNLKTDSVRTLKKDMVESCNCTCIVVYVVFTLLC